MKDENGKAERFLSDILRSILSEKKVARRDPVTRSHRRIRQFLSLDTEAVLRRREDIERKLTELRLLEQKLLEEQRIEEKRLELERQEKHAQRVNGGYLDRLVLQGRTVFARTLVFWGGPNATPRNCELLLSLLLSKSEQDPAIGDFLERYDQKRKRLGRRRADLWAYSDVLRTVWPVLKRKLSTLVKFAVAADWVRRQFHQ